LGLVSRSGEGREEEGAEEEEALVDTVVGEE